MAEKKSTKDILAAARAGAAAKPAEPAAAPAPAAPQATPAPAAAAPAESLGRPLTLKEKLAAARGQGPAPAAPAAAPVAASEAAATPAPAAAAAAPVIPTGRPLTLKEKLAAARGTAAPAGDAPAAAAAPVAKAPAAPKAARELPPLEEITDPKDLAEALRQAGAKKTKEFAPPAPEKKAAPAKKPAEVKTVPGRPSKDAALVESGQAQPSRRFVISIPWIAVAWGSFTLGLSAFSAMLARFLFPNVLAEPPSTIKVGVPGDFGRGEVNEKWKAEWGFWIVRSDMYNGEDIIYALQSVCTHLGCPPNWLGGEQKFKCPCHGSGFYVSGVNFEGPAPRPLERFKVSIADDGQILVDKSQKFQEELAQWNDPDSYLPAV